ncbi:MAG: FtsX-like permease family protein [Solirubrobacterales bacterium]
MSSIFYPKLAHVNIKKNGKFYYPYIITCIGTVAMFYIMCSISFDKGLKKMPGFDSLKYILGLGCIVVGIFAVIFLFYTNSFLIKRRTKEFGLYNILGMEKRHIGKVLFFETIYIGLIGIAFGLFFGILFNKLMILILCKIVNFSVPFGFTISKIGIIYTVILYGCIIIATLFFNIVRIHISKPIELLYNGNAGEKEPKTKWILTTIGLICIFSGYYIAITVKSPLTAITMFFIAVILVIIGTYLLFTTISITILKLLRRNKGYYYNTKNFTSVSGMIFRMKQNAVGLANICILSTMVLVMVSTTVCMYMGVEDSLNARYAKDCIVHINSVKGMESSKAIMIINNSIGSKVRNLTYYTSLDFSAKRNGNDFNAVDINKSYTDTSVAMLDFLTTDEYNLLSGNKVTLGDDEAIVFEAYGKLDTSFNIFNKTYKIKEHLKDLSVNGDYKSLMIQQYFIVLNSKEADYINNSQKSVYGKNASEPAASIMFNIDAKDSEKPNISSNLAENLKKNVNSNIYIENRQASEKDFYALYGGFLFLGLFLGLLFFMATALIIYYKQISEGYEDKSRFEIMQKVGMSREEIKSSIDSQVLKVFFLPIIIAAIHVAGAFNMITKMLALFSLTNIKLFFICSIVTILVFAAIYALIYALTTRVYYKIVE